MLSVKIADKPYQWEKGLMFKNYLPEDEGMLFQFDKPRILKFWGLNTYIPLDVAFISDNKQIIKISRIKKMSMSTVSSNIKCRFALEANDGYFRRKDIKVGDYIDILEKNGQYFVSFGQKE